MDTQIHQTTPTVVRPFRVDMLDEALADLRRRIAATRWPSKELVTDRSQGVQMATIQDLARYWATDYDWRRCEAQLNALPQFVTEIDGVDIHFIHVKSRHADAMPLIITHGWPGSVIEMLGVVGPLTDPTAYGGSAEDAFDLVIPSIPGYGFSAEPTELGWNTGRIARAWAELMHRLGYTRYVAQGGDVGASVEGQPSGGLTRDHILDNIMTYWLTGTGASAAREYWEGAQAAARAVGQAPAPVSLPVGFTTFPGEIFRAPRSWVEKSYPNVTYFHEVNRGGHFAAWEEPELFASEVRAAFRSLR